jgi:multimeric flavodoxin WrbA
MKLSIKILGIAGSPQNRDKSTSAQLARIAMKGAESFSSRAVLVDTEIIYLSEKKIQPCNSCEEPTGQFGLNCGRLSRCFHNDDMTNEIYAKMMDSDGILISSPVHFGGCTAQLKALFDRTCWLKMRKFWGLRNKVGGAIAVAHGRHGGQEMTVVDIEQWMRVSGMFYVSFHAPHREEIEKFHDAYDKSDYYKSFKPDLPPYISACAHWPGAWSAVRGGSESWMSKDWIGLTYAKRLGYRIAQVASWIKPHLPSKSQQEEEIKWFNSLQEKRIRL